MVIHVFSGNSMRAALAELGNQFERASGHKLAVSYDPARVVRRRIAAGESADLALLGEDVIDELIAGGVLEAASRRALLRNGIGLGVRAGAPRPDIGSTAAFVQALRAAPSIAHTTEGASGVYFSSLIDRLGIGAEIRAKAVTQPGGLVGELVTAGRAELAIQQIPELLAVPGVDLVGPLPPEVQKIGQTVAGVFAASKNKREATELVDFLGSPAALAVFRAKGFDPAT